MKLAPLWVRRHISANPDEDTVEGHLVSECARLHVPCLKLKGPSGWFDRIVFWPNGRPSLVEAKRPKGGRFQLHQPRTHKHYRNLGYDVQVLKTKAAVDEFIALWEPICRRFFRSLISVNVPKSLIPSASEIRELKRGKSTGR